MALRTQAVVAADVELMRLREEEAELNRRLAGASLEEGGHATSSAARKDSGALRSGLGSYPAIAHYFVCAKLMGRDTGALSKRLGALYLC